MLIVKAVVEEHQWQVCGGLVDSSYEDSGKMEKILKLRQCAVFIEQGEEMQ